MPKLLIKRNRTPLWKRPLFWLLCLLPLVVLSGYASMPHITLQEAEPEPSRAPAPPPQPAHMKRPALPAHTHQAERTGPSVPPAPPGVPVIAEGDPHSPDTLVRQESRESRLHPATPLPVLSSVSSPAFTDAATPPASSQQIEPDQTTPVKQITKQPKKRAKHPARTVQTTVKTVTKKRDTFVRPRTTANRRINSPTPASSVRTPQRRTQDYLLLEQSLGIPLD